jgi:hypothetical protein
MSFSKHQKPNKALQLTPSRHASLFHDRLPILSTLAQEFYPLSGQLSLAFGYFMKILQLLLFLVSLASYANAASLTSELSAQSSKANCVFSIKVVAHRSPWVEIVSIWKRDKDITDDTIAHALNHFIDEDHVLADPIEAKSMLLFLSSGKITSIDIDHKSLVMGAHLLPLEDAKRIVRSSNKSAEQGAAANP